MQVHEIRCSSLNRPMNCAGVLSMQDLIATEEGFPAKEGTACGEIFKAMLEQRTTTPVLGTHASNGIAFDSDMKFYVRPIAEQLLALNVPILCETRVDWNLSVPQFRIRGSYDASYILGNMLCIDDLKYGWVLVEVKKNWQLLGYAIGEVQRLHATTGYIPEYIRLTIHQPRPHHEEGTRREWIITYAELIEYYGQINARFESIVAGNKTLTTGKHCKYCEAAGDACPAFNRSLYKAIETVMEDWKQDALSNKDISEQLALLDRVTELAKIKKDSLVTLGVTRIRGGAAIPGYVMDESFGHRKWAPDIDAHVIKELTGVNIIEESIATPAQAEKLGVSKSLVNGLSTRYSTGYHLKPGNYVDQAAKVFGENPFGKSEKI